MERNVRGERVDENMSNVNSDFGKYFLSVHAFDDLQMLRRVLGTVALGAGGALTTVLLKPDRVSALRNVSYEPISLWDYNWDFRDPCSCVTKHKISSDPALQNKFV